MSEQGQVYARQNNSVLVNASADFVEPLIFTNITLDICEDMWLNESSASIKKHIIILPRIDLLLFRHCSCHHFCFCAPFFFLSFIALSSRFVF